MSESTKSDPRPPCDGAPPPPDGSAEETALREEVSESAARSTRRFLWTVTILGATLLAVNFTPLRQYVQNIQWIKARLGETGVLAPVVFLVASTVLIAVGVPRLALCGVGGVVFGFVTGAILSQLSSLFGSYATFLFARWGGREWAERRLRTRPGLRFLNARPSITAIILARQLPVAGLLINLGIALTPVRHGVFLAGSLIGLVPGTVVATLLGSGLGKGSAVQICAAVFFALASVVSVWRLRRGRRKPQAPSIPS